VDLQAGIVGVDQEEERHQLTLEALADVDVGNVIDHQAVQAWADSLDTGRPLPIPDR
jgi:ribosomal protein L12E/L44/L45/RPP1/RPP2